MLISTLKFVTDKPSSLTFSMIVNRRCMYRYHRPSGKVYGVILSLESSAKFILVRWDDGKVSTHSIHSVEMVV